jgi:nuclear pore complex protein Nup107
MAKSWLDVQVDLELSQYQTSRPEEKQYDDDMNGTQPMLSSVGPENWPYLVLDQQPRDIAALLQNLHSRYEHNLVRPCIHCLPTYLVCHLRCSDLVHETVSRACQEQHRQIEVSYVSKNKE